MVFDDDWLCLLSCVMLIFLCWTNCVRLIVSCWSYQDGCARLIVYSGLCCTGFFMLILLYCGRSVLGVCLRFVRGRGVFVGALWMCLWCARACGVFVV